MVWLLGTSERVVNSFLEITKMKHWAEATAAGLLVPPLQVGEG